MKESVSKSARIYVDHNLFYNVQYFEDIEDWSRDGADAMAATIRLEFNPRSVVDVGCGSGVLLQALARLGISVTGLDYSDAALNICRDRGLRVAKFDIESNLSVDVRSDLVVSTEVAEHLPDSCADKFVDLLTGVAPDILFTAATPGQSGNDHVNEQPHAYWIEKFAERGFVHDGERTDRIKAGWAATRIASWYQRNLMIFCRKCR